MKTRILAVLLCTCVLLGACSGVPNDTQGTEAATLATQEPVKQPDTTEPPVQSEKEFVKAVYEELPVEDSYYLYGNMQKINADDNFVLYGDKVLFPGGKKPRGLYSYDLNTGKLELYCETPGCSHDTTECRLLRLPRSNLEYYDGKVYSHHHFSTVKVLEDGEWKSLGIYADEAWHAYGDLFTIAGRNLKVYEDGAGEPRTILRDYQYLANVVFGRYLYSHSCAGLVRVDLLANNPVKEVVMETVFCMVEGDHIYYIDDAEETSTYYLYRCDMDGKNSELLLDKPVLPASLNFDDEYLYFRLFTDQKIDGTEEGKDIYRMSKADPSQVEKIATLDQTAYMTFTVPGRDVLFVNTYPYGSGVYVMDSDGSNLRKLEMP